MSGNENVSHGTLNAYEMDLKVDLIIAVDMVEPVLEPDGFLKQV